MSTLREKVLESTGKDLGPLEELKLVDLGSLNEDHTKKKSQDEGAGEDLNTNTMETNKGKKYIINLWLEFIHLKTKYF
mgnify:CR=1 FL=1